MTRIHIEGYFGNLHINLGPIKFWYIIFFKCEEMLFDYCVPRYKCTYIFKTLCELTHTCWTLVFAVFNFGPHKFALSLSLFSR